MKTQTDKPKTEKQATPAVEAAPEAIHTSEPLREFKDTLSSLRKPLDEGLIKKRTGNRDKDGNVGQFDYIPWHEVANILDDTAPSWYHEIKSMQQIGNFVAVVVAITIENVTREGVGTGRADSETGIKKAEHDALKRAAVKFGVARQLYKKEFLQMDSRSGGFTNDFDINRPPTSPTSTGSNNAATDRQLGLISSMCSDLRIKADEECQGILKCKPQQLNKKSASWFISYLETLQKADDDADRFISNTTNGNVAGINSRSTNGSPVTPETKGRLLFEEGNVSRSEDGYVVTEWIRNEQCAFSVTKEGDVVKCQCGDYKTAVHRHGDVAFQCAHKVAIRHFCQASAAQPAS